MRRLRVVGSYVAESFGEWRKDKASRLAASLAFYTLLSMAPLLVLVISIAGLLLGEASARDEIVRQIQQLVGSGAAEVIEGVLDRAAEPGGGSVIATILGGLMLVIGATGVFAELQDSLNTLWEVQPRPDLGWKALLRQRFVSFAMVLGVAFLLLVSLVVSAALALLGKWTSVLPDSLAFVGHVVNFVVSFGVIAVLFTLMYKLVPDVEISWRPAWVGGTVTALLFSLGKLAITAYLGSSSVATAYGAAGSLVILLVWVYYSAQIFFLGAEFTQVYARRHGRPIRPDEHAVRIEPETESAAKASERQRRRGSPRPEFPTSP